MVMLIIQSTHYLRTTVHSYKGSKIKDFCFVLIDVVISKTEKNLKNQTVPSGRTDHLHLSEPKKPKKHTKIWDCNLPPKCYGI